MTDAVKQLALAAIIAYALGNINPSIIIGKLYHVDIRKEGSGNPGMTNTMRVIGFKAGIAVLVVDVLKAFTAVKIGYLLAGSGGAMTAFACVVIGHCYPAVLGFKGGKGVAASLGAALALNWQSALIALAAAAVLFAVSRRMSVCSMGAAAAFPAAIHYFAPEFLYFSIAACIFLILMHIPNIIRLAKGEEKKLTLGHRTRDGSDVSSGENETKDPAENIN